MTHHNYFLWGKHTYQYAFPSNFRFLELPMVGSQEAGEELKNDEER